MMPGVGHGYCGQGPSLIQGHRLGLAFDEQFAEASEPDRLEITLSWVAMRQLASVDETPGLAFTIDRRQLCFYAR